MANQYDHLTPTAIKRLSLPAEKRIQSIYEPRWLGYPHALKILSELDRLHRAPRKNRQPGMLLFGDTNNGKSMIINRFAEKYNSIDDPEEHLAQIPVLLTQAPPKADETRFYENILDSLMIPYRRTGGAGEKQFQVIQALKNSTIRTMVIDEFSNVLAGTNDKRRQFLNAIKNISNELQVNIIGVGTHEARNAIRSDPQLTNRLPPCELPKWFFDNSFRRLLLSFEQVLPLKLPSNLAGKDLSQKLYVMCEGIIGELSNLLELSAEEAIRCGKEKIDPEILANINWIAPSKR